MKKYLSIIFTALVLASALTGCAGRANALEQSEVSDTDVSADMPEPETVPDDSFSKED